jgi:endo-1,4-beta-xylanase
MNRQLLAAMLGVCVVSACLVWAGQGPQTRPAGTRTSAPGAGVPAVPLKALLQKRGMLFGVAAVGRLLADPRSSYAMAVARECSVITPENDMKFGPLRRTADTWNWTNADTLVAFAGRHGIMVHGHTLVWHNQLPKWVTETKRTPQDCRDLMLNHIEAVVGRYRGKVFAWDVVNEAIDKDGTLRKTYWKDKVGDDYIDLAFRKAHEVDPRAKLVYNDYDIEGAGPKADAVYDLVKGMKGRGVPIDAVGFQCHWEVGKYPPLEQIRTNVRRLADLGLEVWITELDLRVKTPSTPEDLALQADAYASLMRMFAQTRVVPSIQTWGLDDGHSWIPHFLPEYGDALLLDKDLRPKPAYLAVSRVFECDLGEAVSATLEEVKKQHD